ncbi:MAG TPA: serine hydrolase [Puia sp.]|jgi:CubicO group peptidase (beta-lactamase class C family)|nr:serine hydrolase [Puia sp.]
MKIIPLALILSNILLSGCAQKPTNNDDKIIQVENNLVSAIQSPGEHPANIKDRMVYYHIHGLSIAVIQNYQILWAKGYGWADLSKKIPVTAQTLFQAASISKSLNGVGLLKLAQEKKLDLYADINTYLTGWKFPYDSLAKGRKISVANLLSHTGGLTVHGFPGYEQGKDRPTIEQILDGKTPSNSPAVRSMYEPGLRSEYSGGGITVSQLILTNITHQPYEEYMKKEVLQPMGMTSSTYAQPPADIQPDLLATAYDRNGEEITGKYHIYPEQAAAGLWTNPTDLAKYIIETQLAYEGRSSKVLDQQTTKLRLTPYLDNSAALGVFIDKRDNTLYFQHGGANEGFRCQYYGSLANGNGVVVMVNSDNGNIMPEIINSVAKVYDFKGLYRSKTTVAVADSLLEKYTGQYALTPTFILVVSKEGNQLFTQATNQPKFKIYAETQTKFTPSEFPAEIEFVKDANGGFNSIILSQNGQRNEGKRITP